MTSIESMHLEDNEMMSQPSDASNPDDILGFTALAGQERNTYFHSIDGTHHSINFGKNHFQSRKLFLVKLNKLLK